MKMGIDLEMKSVQLTLDSYWHKLWHSQQITREALSQASRSQSNVENESRLVLRVWKGVQTLLLSISKTLTP
jgi:hypothetical protein